MIWILPFVVCALWLIGGQLNKGARRWGVPGAIAIASIINAVEVHERAAGTWLNKEAEKRKRRLLWASLAWIPLIGILSVGYGVDSWLQKVLKKDLTVRLAYAIILAVPFLIYEFAAGVPILYIGPTLVLLIGAFQIRGGKLGSIGRFDFLIEDIIRSLTLGGLASWHLA